MYYGWMEWCHASAAFAINSTATFTILSLPVVNLNNALGMIVNYSASITLTTKLAFYYSRVIIYDLTTVIRLATGRLVRRLYFPRGAPAPPSLYFGPGNCHVIKLQVPPDQLGLDPSLCVGFRALLSRLRKPRQGGATLHLQGTGPGPDCPG